jgi:DNA-directed RNA polymerase subunit omega
MARITVEDCFTTVPNPIELVMLAAQRARDLSAGSPLTVERDNDNTPLVAKREIADDTVELHHQRYELIHGLRRHVEIGDQPDDDLMMAYQEQSLVEPMRPLTPPDDHTGFVDLGSAPQPTLRDESTFE